MKAWQIVSDGGIGALELNDIAPRQPGPGEVAVRMRANSINYRDYLTITDPVGRRLPYPRVPNSDGAGEVTAIGAGVTGIKVGDRVASCFFQRWTDGQCSAEAMASALGGALDGVLAEEAVLRADGVVPVPKHSRLRKPPHCPVPLSRPGTPSSSRAASRRATGCCCSAPAAFRHSRCSSAGYSAPARSSHPRPTKSSRRPTLGATVTVNWRHQTDWEKAVLEATNGVGVDVAVEVGGAENLPRTINATRIAGTISLIGAMKGGQIDPAQFMRRSIRIQGIYVGSRRMFLDMNRAIDAHSLKPVIDRTFRFNDAKDAYRRMEGAGHQGKIVIEV